LPEKLAEEIRGVMSEGELCADRLAARAVGAHALGAEMDFRARAKMLG
jgi:hypothetical protein